MGWASGSILMSGAIEAIKDRVKKKDTRMAIYDDIIEALRDAGYDLDD